MKRILQLFATALLFAVLTTAQQTATLHTVSATAATPSIPPAEQIWADLIQGNHRFVAGTLKPEPLARLRATLVKGQQPKVVVLACADSRVAPELIFDQTLGDIFVVRSAGNLADAIGVGSIEYAVEHLHSSVLVVLGHTKCGAVTAACSKEEMPTPNLQAIVDEIKPAVTNAEASAKGDALIEAAIRENIHLSAIKILAVSGVLKRAAEEGKLTVYEAEYNIETGKVVRLDAAAPSN